jgi:uncharacterized membrane protein HdeD (DUF308 family)
MPSPAVIKRVERWVWVLIYGGLLSFVVGLASPDDQALTRTTLMVVGSVLVIIGVALIVLRSRLHLDIPPTP